MKLGPHFWEGMVFLMALEIREGKPGVKMKNVGKGKGGFRWILGLVGVVVILTAIFGY